MNHKTDKAAVKVARDKSKLTCKKCNESFMSRKQRTEHAQLVHNPKKPEAKVRPAAELY